jgi:hypothetical protein
MEGTTKEKERGATPGRGARAKGIWLIAMSLIAIMLCAGQGLADDTSEEGLFTAVAPDAMIVLDLSGSMKWNPPGDHDASNLPTRQYSNPACSGPF